MNMIKLLWDFTIENIKEPYIIYGQAFKANKKDWI